MLEAFFMRKMKREEILIAVLILLVVVPTVISAVLCRMNNKTGCELSTLLSPIQILVMMFSPLLMLGGILLSFAGAVGAFFASVKDGKNLKETAAAIFRAVALPVACLVVGYLLFYLTTGFPIF